MPVFTRCLLLSFPVAVGLGLGGAGCNDEPISQGGDGGGGADLTANAYDGSTAPDFSFIPLDFSRKVVDLATPDLTPVPDFSVLADLTGLDLTVPPDLVPPPDLAGLPRFSFFVTSLKAMQKKSGNMMGFGGDLRFGEVGPGAGLKGADKLCASIAEDSMPGAGGKGWHAFLSAADGGNGNQVNAIDRIGNGPWYDRIGRLFANNKNELMFDRPQNSDPAIKNDFPNEDGVPNHQPDPNQGQVDNHDMLTGSNNKGQLYSKTGHCVNWTANAGNKQVEGLPRVGHSWPRGIGPTANWMSSLDESGCAPGVSLIEMGPPNPNSNTVGSGGGYGGIYCFASVP